MHHALGVGKAEAKQCTERKHGTDEGHQIARNTESFEKRHV